MNSDDADDADADDTDAVGSNLAPKGKGSCEKSGNLQLSLQQITIGFSVGSWLLLCLVELATVAADGEFSHPRWWSFLIGGVVLLITLVLVVFSRIQARSTAERKFTSVAPMELERSDEPRAPQDRKWSAFIHGHLLAGALLWIAVHIVNDQYQQVWRGLTTLYSIIGFGTVGVFCGRLTPTASEHQPLREAGGEDRRQRQRLENRSGGAADGRNLKKAAAPVVAAAEVEPPFACPRSLDFNSGIKRKWQPLFRDPTFGNSVEGAPRIGSVTSMNSLGEAVMRRRSSESRAGFKFVEEDVQALAQACGLLESQGSKNSKRSFSRSRPGLHNFVVDDANAEAAASVPVGYELRRQQSKMSSSSAMSDVSKSEDQPQAAASSECKLPVSKEMLRQLSRGGQQRGGSSASCGGSSASCGINVRRSSGCSLNSGGSALSDVFSSQQASGSQAQAKKAPAPPACQQPPPPASQLSSSSVDPGGQRSMPSKNSSCSVGSALSDISEQPPLSSSVAQQQQQADKHPALSAGSKLLQVPACQPSSSSSRDPGGQRSMPSKNSSSSVNSALSALGEQQAASSSDCVLVSLPG